jgi:hypothetical protein
MRVLVGVSADGATPVYMLTTGHLAQGTALTDMGAPAPPTIINPNAVGVSDDAQSVMALDLNNHVWAARKNTAGTWNWTDLTAMNVPANLTLESVLRVTQDAHASFLVSKDGHLWRMSWDGTSSPQWTNVSTSATNPGPHAFVRFDIAGDGSTVMVASKDFHLWSATRSGTNWTWADLGVPH